MLINQYINHWYSCKTSFIFLKTLDISINVSLLHLFHSFDFRYICFIHSTFVHFSPNNLTKSHSLFQCFNVSIPFFFSTKFNRFNNVYTKNTAKIPSTTWISLRSTHWLPFPFTRHRLLQNYTCQQLDQNVQPQCLYHFFLIRS